MEQAKAGCKRAYGAGELVKFVTMSFGAAGGGLAILLIFVNQPDWWRGLGAAMAVNGLAVVVSIPPLAWGVHGGVNRALFGCFVAAGGRMVVTIGGCVVALTVGGYPPVPTVVLMVVLYLVLLAVESIYIAKALWSASA